MQLGAKYVRTYFSQLGASARMNICSNAPSCLRLKANVLCVSCSTLKADNSVIISRASAMYCGSARTVSGNAHLSLACKFLASCSCCLSVVANIGPMGYKQLRLTEFNVLGAGLCICELGCLTTRVIANWVNVVQFSVGARFSEGLFASVERPILHKRMFWCQFVSLSV
ncbi:MAG: hypothetical protein AAI946_00035 [Candidatus Hodgkinia cicadicola]